ncbi:MAG: transglutaminase-like domain-containing protein [Clostridium sp.]|nr:transglutaminase-like domain-containing protein [Clostridium sp.]
MDGKIRGYRYTDILAYVLIPFTVYLFIGLMVINLSGINVSKTYYFVWGVPAVIAVGIREYVQNRQLAHGQADHGITGTTVTMGIGVYVAAVTAWFCYYKEGQCHDHTALAIVSLGIAFLLWKLLKYKWIRMCIGYASLLALIGFEFADVHFSKVMIALAIFLFLHSVSETLSNRNSFIGIYMAAALAVAMIPAPEDPYDWNFVVSAVKAMGRAAETISVEIEYQIRKWGWDGIFHYGFSGYSDSSMSLSMGLDTRDIEQLRLWGGKTTRNLYLRGNICDSYMGDRWETQITEETLDYRMDTLMMLYAIFDYTQEARQLRQFVKVHRQELTIQNIKTQSVFSPLKTFEVTADNIKAEGDNLRGNKVFSRGPAYTYGFIDVDYASEEMNDILNRSSGMVYKEDVYDAMFEKMPQYYGVTLEKPPYQDFLKEVAKGEKAVKEQYLDLGDAVSDAVKHLADSITEDCRNDYEKCRALEEYLHQYGYNQGVVVPEGVNILDWFLFDGKEGYCVHYATALATMLRCEGIPSRIAEGFLVDYSNTVGLNLYSVSGSSAHAWVEAYLDGIGWIRLEPTPVFAGNAYEIWYSKNEAEDLEEEEGEEYGGDIEEEEEEEEEEETTGETEQISKQESGDFLPAILLGLAVLAMGSIFVIVPTYRRARLRKNNDPDVVFSQLLSALGKKYVSRTEEETVREYFKRLSETEQVEVQIKECLETAVDLMEAYWYGSRRVDGQELEMIKEIRKGVLQKKISSL